MIPKQPKMIKRLSDKGMFKACLVTQPSIIPAQMVKGTVLKNILNEFIKFQENTVEQLKKYL